MAKCKSCGAEIVWIKMASGKAMPCDAKKITIVTDTGLVQSGYLSHFSTCPNANQHRNR